MISPDVLVLLVQSQLSMAWENSMHLANRANSPMSPCKLQNLNCPDVRLRISPPLLFVSLSYPRHERAQRFHMERCKTTYRRSEARLPRAVSRAPLLTKVSHTSHRIILENAPKVSDETRPRKRRRLARGVHGRHAQDMSLITPENIHQRSQWHVTPLGRLIRPMRMRPARPLGLPIETLRAKKLKGKERISSRSSKKKSREPPTRARRQTIDPLRWGSTQINGIFLEGNGNGDDRGGANGGESTEVEEVEDILEVSDRTPPRDDTTSTNAAVAALDLAAETANALDLLNAMFGEANADWGGAETVDADVEMAGADADIPHPAPDLLEPTDFETIPAAHDSHPSQRVENTIADGGQAEATPPAPKTTNREQPSTKLKDLFAPREGGGQFLAISGYMSLINPSSFFRRLLLPYRSSRSRLGARPRHGPGPERARLPKRPGHHQSRRAISLRAHDATEGI